MPDYGEQNTKVASHALELGAKIIKNVEGEEISSHVGGEPATDDQSKSAIAAKMQARFATRKPEGSR